MLLMRLECIANGEEKGKYGQELTSEEVFEWKTELVRVCDAVKEEQIQELCKIKEFRFRKASQEVYYCLGKFKEFYQVHCFPSQCQFHVPIWIWFSIFLFFSPNSSSSRIIDYSRKTYVIKVSLSADIDNCGLIENLKFVSLPL